MGTASEGLILLGKVPGSQGDYEHLLSTNWSGYVQYTKSKGKFTAVEDIWKVPKVETTKKGKQFASDWVGIGGYKDATLVQAGTAEWNDNGKARYNAWTEVIPYSEVPIAGLRIKPGDLIKTTVVQSSRDVWVMTMRDLTSGHSGGRTVHYKSGGKSVEAIHERPGVRNGVSTLATTSNVVFDPGFFATSAPGKPVWRPLLRDEGGAKLAQIVMVNNKVTVTFATPSVPSSDEEGFSVAYGPSAPKPPN